MHMKTVAITGLSGVLGTVLLRHPKARNYHICDMYHTRQYTGTHQIKKHIVVDLLQKTTIHPALYAAKPDKILHLAAITHIDACETDKWRGKNGIVWQMNVESVREIAAFGRKHNVPIIYMSTECVFDGRQEFYDETAKKRPINWYGQTKSEAEDIILSSNTRNSVMRAAIAYHKRDGARTLLGKIYKNLIKTAVVPVVSDQLITPTYTYDVTDAILDGLSQDTCGIYHISPNQAITPYTFAELVARSYGYTTSHLRKTTLEQLYGRERALLRLRHACLWTRSLPTSRSPNTILGGHKQGIYKTV